MRPFYSILSAARNLIEEHLYSYRDYRVPKNHAKKYDSHIVVFESDDWGSIRMSNKKDWEELKAKGYAVDKRPYERYDTLESSNDLEALFEVLMKYKDFYGNHPVITANMLMANPDFVRIEQSGFQHYCFEHISATYTRYFGNAKVLDIMRQGIEEGIFMPQSHGREHFNVNQWIRGLQDGDKDLMIAFKYGMCGIAPKTHPEKGNQLMKALYAENEDMQKGIDLIVAEGLRMFEKFWGFKSQTFVAPCYLWSKKTETTLAKQGVKLIQTTRSAKPAYKTPSRKFYSGQRNKKGVLYSIRNCHFEPSTNKEDRDVTSLLRQVDKIFSQGKIAVFSSHRINYTSRLEEKNRTRTLSVLDQFFSHLLKKYPDVTFMSSDKLIEVFRS